MKLETTGLRRSFGRTEVIRGLELQVPAGSVYGFLGRNGAGKTTAIRMLMGILHPDAGTMTFGDLTVRRTTARMRARVGYVSQQQHFYPWMRVDHLGAFVGAFYPTWERARFAALCEQLAIRRDQRAGELSGGTRMKLALALALAHRPPLLILDEPTAGVDPVTRREILDLLRERVDQDGATVLFSSHQISEIEEIGDQIGILHEGRIFWQGPVAAFAERVRRVDGVVVWGEPEQLRDLPGAEPVSLEAAFVAIARQDRR